MPNIATLCDYLQSIAPLTLAEDWDNVGLLVGDQDQPLRQVMTCLTITPASASEAIRRGAGLIVTHHPLPFHSLQKITADNTTGRLLLDLIGAGTAIYSAHTAFDSARAGINQDLAEGLGLEDIAAVNAIDGASDGHAAGGLGAGRYGTLSAPLDTGGFVARVKEFLQLTHVRAVTTAQATVSCVGVACGSGGQFLADARERGCDTFVTGEANFHSCLEAAATGIRLILVGHYASERFAMERLAAQLQSKFGELEVWASQSETDPLELF